MWGRLSLLDTRNLQGCETLTAHSPQPRRWTSSPKPGRSDPFVVYAITLLEVKDPPLPGCHVA